LAWEFEDVLDTCVTVGVELIEALVLIFCFPVEIVSLEWASECGQVFQQLINSWLEGWLWFIWFRVVAKLTDEVVGFQDVLARNRVQDGLVSSSCLGWRQGWGFKVTARVKEFMIQHDLADESGFETLA